MEQFRSRHAIMAKSPQGADVENRVTPIYGVMLHTTGRGILQRAEKQRVTPLKAAVDLYTGRGANFAHYVIDQVGMTVQIADEDERAPQAGITTAQRQLYLTGEWEKKVNPKALAMWKARWSNHKSPSHLYPTRSPNDCYVGIEMIPDPQAQFSKAQVFAAAVLVDDILHRHRIDIDIDAAHDLVRGNPHIVGHEDIEPLERWDAGGGWDPGALRLDSRFDWVHFMREFVIAGIDRMELFTGAPVS